MPPPYFVGQPTPKQGAHHESIMALWELKWKKRVSTLRLLALFVWLDWNLGKVEKKSSFILDRIGVKKN